MIFPKDKGVGMLTLNLFGENTCVMRRTHQNCQLPSFLSFLPNHLFCQKVVEVVIAWKWKSTGNSELGRVPSFGMLCFSCMDKKTLELYSSLTHVFNFWFYSHVLGAAGHSVSFIIFVPHLCGSSVVAELFLCVSFAFCECVSLGKTMIVVLQHCLKLQSVRDHVARVPK